LYLFVVLNEDLIRMLNFYQMLYSLTSLDQ